MKCNNCGREIDNDTKPLEFTRGNVNRKLYLCEACSIMCRRLKW